LTRTVLATEYTEATELINQLSFINNHLVGPRIGTNLGGFCCGEAGGFSFSVAELEGKMSLKRLNAVLGIVSVEGRML